MRVVDAVHLRDAERPGAAFGGRDRLDVDGGEDPGARSSSSSMSPARSTSNVTNVRFAAWAMVATSLRRPIQTLPASSAQRAWNKATSGAMAGT